MRDDAGDLKVDKVRDGTNRRLTVMLKNVPNRYTKEAMHDVLEQIIPGRGGECE